MALDVVTSSANTPCILLKPTYGKVASMAEEFTHNPCLVIVIDPKISWNLTDSTTSSLFDQHGVILLTR